MPRGRRFAVLAGADTQTLGISERQQRGERWACRAPALQEAQGWLKGEEGKNS